MVALVVALAVGAMHTFRSRGRSATIADLPFLEDVHIKQELFILDSPPPGYEPARMDAEWEDFFQTNLYDDLRKYYHKTGLQPGSSASGSSGTSTISRGSSSSSSSSSRSSSTSDSRARSSSRSLSSQDGDNTKETKFLSLRELGDAFKQLFRSETGRHSVIVVLWRGKAYVGRQGGNLERYIINRVNTTLHTLTLESRRLNLSLPDAVFGFNAADEPACRLNRMRGCPVPIFSMFKRYNHTERKVLDSDVLLPHMFHRYDRLMFFPWAAKDRRAVMRSTMQKSMSADCVRMQLAALSASPAGAPWLDVGFSINAHPNLSVPTTYMRPWLQLEDHARSKFLVNADGHTASCRLGYLMQMNSVVLKQESPWIEYYYRSLQPGTHVLTYNTSNLLSLLQAYNDPARDGELRLLVNASQHFVARFLTTEGKVRYAVRALHEYAALFGPGRMSGFVASQLADTGLLDESMLWAALPPPPAPPPSPAPPPPRAPGAQPLEASERPRRVRRRRPPGLPGGQGQLGRLSPASVIQALLDAEEQ
ncbi:hypothetical protein CHLRE_17g716350v5 [Chlamydomonas reinhardtii]|uniref:Glycosyl transferase CAP10 domain-containing protein n=1 Tax=Chlamydomonas reinhardtii TaxID=3055 RepID=A0A2K3CPZ4_CHLRE|nr:uncharacterized protein CHLRE_17g716350v5 [Chlamydomonas reinhardtii]PNW70350.1 hypothetical protein CHLRE_17g716350v5 [Chlamydomonas reinhardtii]